MSATNPAGRTHRSTLRRRGIVATVALGLTVGLAAAVPAIPADAAAKAKAKITITAPATVASGSLAKISGTVKDSSTKKPVKRVKVKVQQRTPGTGWKTLRTVKTSATGKWVATAMVAKHTDFQASVTGGKHVRPSISKVKTVSATQSLTVTSTVPRMLDAGGSVTVTGVASPGLVGTVVTLQQWSGRNWAGVGTASVLPNRTFSVAGVMTTPGSNLSLRVFVNGAAKMGVAPAEAAAGSVNVYGWFSPSYSLNSPVKWDSSSLGSQNETVVVQGTRYFGAIVLDSARERLVYRTDGKCDQFRATLAVVDTKWGTASPYDQFTAQIDLDSKMNAWQSPVVAGRTNVPMAV
ncbi:MAG: hypothetical protein LBM66_02535, partial [Bifidobacteriaceae bacterium]|nr:hypothetical protein [Bifidobacteriaceae bacterium]